MDVLVNAIVNAIVNAVIDDMVDPPFNWLLNKWLNQWLNEAKMADRRCGGVCGHGYIVMMATDILMWPRFFVGGTGSFASNRGCPFLATDWGLPIDWRCSNVHGPAGVSVSAASVQTRAPQTRTRRPVVRAAAAAMAILLAAGSVTACSGGGDEPIVFSGSGEATGD